MPWLRKPTPRDDDFSATSIARHMQEGYAAARETLATAGDKRTGT